MNELAVVLDALYGLIGAVFVAGVGAMLLMFAFVQITARAAIWLDVGKAYAERKQLADEVLQLKAALDTLAGVDQDAEPELDPNEPLVTAIKVGEPRG